MDKAMGKAKEAYGALTGDEAKKAEGRAEQRKAEAEAEARQREKTKRRRPRPGKQRRSATGRDSRTKDPWVVSRTPPRISEALRTS
jgi:uncharacterized protein YjbJ (UPF0337 family)